MKQEFDHENCVFLKLLFSREICFSEIDIKLIRYFFPLTKLEETDLYF